NPCCQQRPINSMPAKFLENASSPKAGKVALQWGRHAPDSDRFLSKVSHERQIALERIAQHRKQELLGRTLVVPDRTFNSEEISNPLLVRYRLDDDTCRSRRQQRRRHLLQIQNHERLFLPDLETAAAQALEQVRRFIMAIDLPFKTPLQFGEKADLAADHHFRFLRQKARINNAIPRTLLSDCAHHVRRLV